MLAPVHDIYFILLGVAIVLYLIYSLIMIGYTVLSLLKRWGLIEGVGFSPELLNIFYSCFFFTTLLVGCGIFRMWETYEYLYR